MFVLNLDEIPEKSSSSSMFEDFSFDLDLSLAKNRCDRPKFGYPLIDQYVKMYVPLPFFHDICNLNQ